LKLSYDEPLPSPAFKFNWRRYIEGVKVTDAKLGVSVKDGVWHGMAVQVDPIKPTLQAPGTERLKLKCDILLSILLQFCFQFQLAPLPHGSVEGTLDLVGRCRLTVSKPALKAKRLCYQRLKL